MLVITNGITALNCYQMNIIVMGRTWTFAFFVTQNLENQFPVEDHAASSGLVIVASIFVALRHEVKL